MHILVRANLKFSNIYFANIISFDTVLCLIYFTHPIGWICAADVRTIECMTCCVKMCAVKCAKFFFMPHQGIENYLNLFPLWMFLFCHQECTNKKICLNIVWKEALNIEMLMQKNCYIFTWPRLVYGRQHRCITIYYMSSYCAKKVCLFSLNSILL